MDYKYFFQNTWIIQKIEDRTINLPNIALNLLYLISSKLIVKVNDENIGNYFDLKNLLLSFLIIILFLFLNNN